MRQVRAITPKGKIALAGVRTFFRAYHFVSGRRYPRKDFEENSATMRLKDVLYLGYKYYYKDFRRADKGSGLETYFRVQNLDFTPPEGFEEQSRIKLNAGGDLIPYRWMKPRHTRHLWDEIGDTFFDADIVYANLETPVDTESPGRPVPEVMLNEMLFNAGKDILDIFHGNAREKTFDIVSTANNHVMDAGAERIAATLEYLESKGIAHCGSARSPEERDQIPIIERKGIKVAFVSYTYSMNALLPVPGQEYLANCLPLNVREVDLSLVIKHVQSAREQGADIIVGALHTGCAYQPYPGQHTVDIYHRIFEETGIDIILGCHPHNPQPMEKYEFKDPFSGKTKQGFAIYSMGDFVAYDINIYCHLPFLLHLDISKGMLNGKIHTQLSSVKLTPVYHALQKSLRRRRHFEFRFYKLPELMNQLKEGNIPEGFTRYNRKEARHLSQWMHKYILPEKSDKIL